MAEFRCKISVREDMSKYLGAVRLGGPLKYEFALHVADKDDPDGTDWIVRDIPGTSSKVLFKNGGLADGAVATWVGGPDNIMMLTTYSPGWDEQVARFDELDGGYVAINNHDKTRVMDRSANPEKRYVISFPWNGGTNQQWFLHDH